LLPAKAIAFANLKRAERGQNGIIINSLAPEIGVAATTVTRLARTDERLCRHCRWIWQGES